MRKSIVLTSILSILSISAFADITGSSNCTEGVLGTSANGSTANIDANWSQNRININWYNGNTKVSESYCMYDDTIVLPTEPSKPGYTFAGWQLRTATKQCWEITNENSCSASNGCYWYNNACYKTVEDCQNIEENCESHYGTWFSQPCVYVPDEQTGAWSECWNYNEEWQAG